MTMKHFRFVVDDTVGEQFKLFVLEESARRKMVLSQEQVFSEWVMAGCPLPQRFKREPLDIPPPGFIAPEPEVMKEAEAMAKSPGPSAYSADPSPASPQPGDTHIGHESLFYKILRTVALDVQATWVCVKNDPGEKEASPIFTPQENEAAIFEAGEAVTWLRARGEAKPDEIAFYKPIRVEQRPQYAAGGVSTQITDSHIQHADPSMPHPHSAASEGTLKDPKDDEL